jgi:hypothetical protein
MRRWKFWLIFVLGLALGYGVACTTHVNTVPIIQDYPD